VRLVERAVSDTIGAATFFEDNISGQNNSLLAVFAVADGVAESHGVPLKRLAQTVQLTTLDAHIGDEPIDFLEGAELQVLRGATGCLERVRSLMAEVSHDHQAVLDLLLRAWFQLFHEDGRPLNRLPEDGNTNNLATRVGLPR
jgi:hypothetical protein